MALPKIDPLLSSFYERLLKGVTVSELLAGLAEVYRQKRAGGMMARYRIGKRPYKKLRDEVTPLARFARCHALKRDRVQLVESDPPDFLLWHKGVKKPREIECTLAGGKPRFHAMSRLNDVGELSGFCGLPDEAPSSAFKEAIERGGTYTTEEVIKGMAGWIITACNRKRDGTYADTLLIEGTMLYLKTSDWKAHKQRLCDAAAKANFKEVYLVGYTTPKEICFRLK